MSKPYKTILCIDFETVWDSKEYTLSKMTTEEYIRDERFHAHGACIHEVGADTKIQWYSHRELPKILAMYDWTTTAVVGHNAMFDVGILSLRYGVNPCFIFDTLSMARAMRGSEAGNSLAKLAEAYGYPPKGRAVYSTDGLRELDAQTEKELADYCKHDVYLCEQIFGKLMMRVFPDGSTAGPYPTKELRLIDMTLRMFTEPEFELDRDLLEKALVEENDKLAAALTKVSVEPTQLASNDMFADVLRSLGVEPPQKVSKTTGKLAYAFAKTDALFQALLNGDNEDAALMCEARLKVKSTLERTRAQRFIDISKRGRLPVPLHYYGAGTGRYAATGNINMQNMKRGSFLRKSIMAPDGYVICAGDLSQIEPRVLAWLSDYDEMLDIFRAGGDPYATFGSGMFGVPNMTKESHPLLRQSAKSALLGCFGSQTPVLTKRVWVTIVDVTMEDQLWDGVEWVAHSGLLEQGEKDVWTIQGVSATPGHEILTEHGWLEWSAVATDPSLFQSALSSGSLSAFGGTAATHTGSKAATLCSRGFAAVVGGKGTSTAATCGADAQSGATSVQKEKHTKQGLRNAGLLKSVRTPPYVTGSLIVSAQSSFDVLIQKARRGLTTVGAVLQCTRNGLRTGLRSFATLLGFPVMTCNSYNLTASTTTAGMFRATCALSHEAPIWQTSGRSQPEKSLNCTNASQPLKQKMQTYDIALAGPRNRYTILTDAGPIIVHNCGYQLGWASFAGQLLTGFLGVPPQRYTKADAKQLGVTANQVSAFIANGENLKKMEKIAHTCTDDELLIHCLAAKAIIDKYRAAAHPVAGYWELLGNLIVHSLIEGNEYNHKGVLTFRKGEIEMVNGMRMYYRDIKAEKDEKGRVQYSFSTGKLRKKLYAGLLANNTTQGLARIVMTDGLLRVQKRFPVKGTVHDEGLVLVPEAGAAEGSAWIKEQMIQVPKWMPGIPLNADVGFNKRYGLAKG